MRRIRIESSVSSELSLLEQLGQDYKAFKKLNPEKTARIPREMKEQAKAVLEGGAKIQTIAETVGLTVPSIARWLETLERKPNPVKSGRRPKVTEVESAVAMAEVHTPIIEAAKATPPKSEQREWVKIRISGREIEIARADFWEIVLGTTKA